MGDKSKKLRPERLRLGGKAALVAAAAGVAVGGILGDPCRQPTPAVPRL